MFVCTGITAQKLLQQFDLVCLWRWCFACWDKREEKGWNVLSRKERAKWKSGHKQQTTKNARRRTKKKMRRRRRPLPRSSPSSSRHRCPWPLQTMMHHFDWHCCCICWFAYFAPLFSLPTTHPFVLIIMVVSHTCDCRSRRLRHSITAVVQSLSLSFCLFCVCHCVVCVCVFYDPIRCTCLPVCSWSSLALMRLRLGRK